MIKRQKLIGIVTSVVLAAIGATLLVVYVRGADDRATSGQELADVLVVAETIPMGTKAEEIGALVRVEKMPTRVVADGALASTGPLAGQVAVVDLLPGEQLVRGRFASPSEVKQAGVPEGMLQVTVTMETVRSVGGQVRKGDTVAVLVSFDEPETTHIILHKVLVSDVRDADGISLQTTSADASPVGNLFVTLALDAPSVEKVVFGAEHGRLWLAWQPVASGEGGTQVVTKAAVNL